MNDERRIRKAAKETRRGEMASAQISPQKARRVFKLWAKPGENFHSRNLLVEWRIEFLGVKKVLRLHRIAGKYFVVGDRDAVIAFKKGK